LGHSPGWIFYREDSVLKKSLFFGIAAALCAAIIFTACPTDPEVEYRDKIVDRPVDRPVYTPVHADKTAIDETSLTVALADPGSRVIALISNATLTDDLEVPAGKTLILYAGLDTSNSALTIKGTTIVAPDGGLTATNSGIATVTGTLEVYQGGTVDLDEAESLVGLGTSVVQFKGGTLVAPWPTDPDEIATAFGYVTYGALDITSATHSLKLSDLAGISGIGETHALIATTTTDEDATSLSIPLGAFFMANGSDDLDTVTTLSVYGGLNAPDATGAGGGITITVGPKAILQTGNITALSGGSFTAPAGSTVNRIAFPASASISALDASEITIEGTLSIPANSVLELGSDLVLDDGATLVIPDPGKVSGTGKIIAEDIKGTITIATFPDFTTTGTGIAGDDLAATALTLRDDAEKLTNKAELVLDGTFGTVDVTGIGSTALTSSTAADVLDGSDASAGVKISLNSGTSLKGTVTATSVDGTDADEITVGNVTLSLNSEDLQIDDSDATNSGAKYAVVTFGGVKIQNTELISPVLPAFNIGIKTVR
jgi:hypothetical protein